MKKSRFTKNQIISILKEADSGMPIAQNQKYMIWTKITNQTKQTRQTMHNQTDSGLKTTQDILNIFSIFLGALLTLGICITLFRKRFHSHRTSHADKMQENQQQALLHAKNKINQQQPLFNQNTQIEISNLIQRGITLHQMKNAYNRNAGQFNQQDSWRITCQVRIIPCYLFDFIYS